MNDKLKLVTAPAVEPVSSTEVKAHLRITGTDDDSDITRFIETARKDWERRTNTSLIATVWDYALDKFPSGEIALPRATPLASVTSVKYTDSDDSETTLSSTLYVTDTHSRRGAIKPAYGETWPSFTPRPFNPIIIRYTGGVANAAAVDEDIKNWILERIGFYFENREEALAESGGVLDLSPFLDGIVKHHRVDWAF